MRAQVMVVGVYHLGNTGDLISINNKKDNDIGKQAEEVVEALSKFNPTKLAVEAITDEQLRLNERFREYQQGNHILSKNEIEVIGFPLAKMSGISEISCIDWMGNEEDSTPIGDVLNYAGEHELEIYEKLMKNYIEPMQQQAALVSELSILEGFKLFNEPQTVQRLHQLNMDFAMIGKERNYLAMDWLTWWYKRNLIIYTNVRRLITNPEERVVLLIGGSHVHLVKQFLAEADVCTLVDASDYLK